MQKFGWDKAVWDNMESLVCFIVEQAENYNKTANIASINKHQWAAYWASDIQRAFIYFRDCERIKVEYKGKPFARTYTPEDKNYREWFGEFCRVLESLGYTYNKKVYLEHVFQNYNGHLFFSYKPNYPEIYVFLSKKNKWFDVNMDSRDERFSKLPKLLQGSYKDWLLEDWVEAFSTLKIVPAQKDYFYSGQKTS